MPRLQSFRESNPILRCFRWLSLFVQHPPRRASPQHLRTTASSHLTCQGRFRLTPLSADAVVIPWKANPWASDCSPFFHTRPPLRLLRLRRVYKGYASAYATSGNGRNRTFRSIVPRRGQSAPISMPPQRTKLPLPVIGHPWPPHPAIRCQDAPSGKCSGEEPD